MSYLDIPRIHIGGKFFTDPSTVNNDPTHYDPDCTNPSPWQEPNGNHFFKLSNCAVRSVFGPAGFLDNDALLGATVESTDTPSPAKLVDLDVYQQGISTIYGMQIKITLGDGSTLMGTLDPAVLNGVSFNMVLPTRGWNEEYGMDSNGGDMNACGYFQSVLHIAPADWKSTAPTVQLLKNSTITDPDGNYMLSFKFVMDGYQNVPQNSEFRYGRLVGTFGPVKLNEPLYNAGQRWLQPRAFNQKTDPWYWPFFNSCPFKVDTQRSKLIIDMANSICRQSAGGDPVDLGILTALAQVGGGGNPSLLGTVDYTAFAYSNNAHISEVDLSPRQLAEITSGGLVLTSSLTTIGNPNVMFENATIPVEYVVETRPVRMPGDPGTTATTQVYVSQGGQPVSGKQLTVTVVSVHGTTPGATVPPSNPGNTPQADGALTATITPSDVNGFATVTLTVMKDPGQRTVELDGQLYFILVDDPANPTPGLLTNPPIQEHQISCIAFSQYAVNTNPTWEEVQSMMQPYMKLYPSMKNRIDLTDFTTFRTFALNPPWLKGYNDPRVGPLGIKAGAIGYYFTFLFNDPRYMPLSRDLSPNRLMTVLYYILNLQNTPQSAESK